jgi:activator of HSP90 ATPase
MKSNTTQVIVAIMLIATLVSAISFLAVAAVEVRVFADRDFQLEQMNKCSTDIKVEDSSKVYTGGAASSSSGGSNEYSASTSAAAAPGTGTVCNIDDEISYTDKD